MHIVDEAANLPSRVLESLTIEPELVDASLKAGRQSGKSATATALMQPPLKLNRKARRAMVSVLRRNARRRARYERRVKKILLEAIRRANRE